MSQENVEAFRRGVDSINRRDIEAMLEVLDPEVEWHDVFSLMFGGDAAVYRGHEGVRKLFRDLFDAFAETHSTYSEIRDLGDRTVATGLLSARGNESGAGIEAPIWTIAQWKNGRVTWIRTYLDPKEALQAAGLEE
jgi:ketosteroid isomerase-like protein